MEKIKRQKLNVSKPKGDIFEPGVQVKKATSTKGTATSQGIVKNIL